MFCTANKLIYSKYYNSEHPESTTHNSENEINSIWVPSYIGLNANIGADKSAKDVTNTSIVNIPIQIEDLL